MVAKRLKPDTLVWAKLKGYSPWPGKIVMPPTEAKPKKYHHYVFFFGSNNYAWVPNENIELHNKKLVQKYGNKKTGLYQTAVETIVEYSKGISKKIQSKNSRVSKKLKQKPLKKLSTVKRVSRKKKPQSPSSLLSDEDYAQLIQHIPPNLGYDSDLFIGMRNENSKADDEIVSKTEDQENIFADDAKPKPKNFQSNSSSGSKKKQKPIKEPKSPSSLLSDEDYAQLILHVPPNLGYDNDLFAGMRNENLKADDDEIVSETQDEENIFADDVAKPEPKNFQSNNSSDSKKKQKPLKKPKSPSSLLSDDNFGYHTDKITGVCNQSSKADDDEIVSKTKDQENIFANNFAKSKRKNFQSNNSSVSKKLKQKPLKKLSTVKPVYVKKPNSTSHLSDDNDAQLIPHVPQNLGYHTNEITGVLNDVISVVCEHNYAKLISHVPPNLGHHTDKISGVLNDLISGVCNENSKADDDEIVSETKDQENIFANNIAQPKRENFQSNNSSVSKKLKQKPLKKLSTLKPVSVKKTNSPSRLSDDNYAQLISHVPQNLGYHTDEITGVLNDLISGVCNENSKADDDEIVSKTKDQENIFANVAKHKRKNFQSDSSSVSKQLKLKPLKKLSAGKPVSVKKPNSSSSLLDDNYAQLISQVSPNFGYYTDKISGVLNDEIAGVCSESSKADDDDESVSKTKDQENIFANVAKPKSKNFQSNNSSVSKNLKQELLKKLSIVKPVSVKKINSPSSLSDDNYAQLISHVPPNLGYHTNKISGVLNDEITGVYNESSKADDDEIVSKTKDQENMFANIAKPKRENFQSNNSSVSKKLKQKPVKKVSTVKPVYVKKPNSPSSLSDNYAQLISHVPTNLGPTTKKIGFLGLGKITQTIVKNLCHSGHSVIVWNHMPGEYDELAQHFNVQVAGTPADVLDLSDIIFNYTDDSEGAKNLVFGNCGIIQQLERTGKKKDYVEMTSIDPKTSKNIGHQIRLKGGRYLEAPITGLRFDVNEGMLLIIAAGDKTLYEECKSCFDAISKRHKFVGVDVGTAAKYRLFNNMVIATTQATIVESLALVSKTGLDTEIFIDIIKESAFSSDNVAIKGMSMERNEHVSNITLKKLQQDLNLGLKFGDKVSQSTPIFATTNEIYKHCKSMMYGHHDVSDVF